MSAIPVKHNCQKSFCYFQIACYTGGAGPGKRRVVENPIAPHVTTIDRVLRALCFEKEGLISSWPDLDREDLRQRCWEAILEAWPSYDPARSQPHTWAYRIASARIIDAVRMRERETRRVRETATGEVGEIPRKPGESDDAYTKRVELRRLHVISNYQPKPTYELPGEPEELAEIAAALYAKVKENLRRYLPTNAHPAHRPPAFTNAQGLTIAALQREWGLTCRGMRHLLLTDGAMQRALGLARVPAHQSFWRAGKKNPVPKLK
jgi:DNA-directed RNA polymerase specialized sigma24 family protein